MLPAYHYPPELKNQPPIVEYATSVPKMDNSIFVKDLLAEV